MYLWVRCWLRVGILGRNGTGKTTLFNVMSDKDKDYDGAIVFPKNQLMLSTNQEHHGFNGTALDYLCTRLPHYSRLHTIIETYPEKMGNDLTMINAYSEALENFGNLGYFDIENSAQSYCNAYQLPPDLLQHSFHSLSGGQKRLVELIIIQLAEPHLALLDEPTNHMDYVAKEAFVSWLQRTKSAVLVISHDRDVLSVVDRVIELKDKKAYSYPGNYDNYLKQNAIKTTNAMHTYKTTEKQIVNLREQIEYAKSRAPGYKGKAGKNPWIVMRDRLQRELDGILNHHEKPSFWIDKTSASMLKPDVVASYQNFKAKNITLHKTSTPSTNSSLVEVQNLSLGYDGTPLFSNVSFSVAGNERMHIIGRNGAGKTTLVNAIVDASLDKKPNTLIGKGYIDTAKRMVLSRYEQEVSSELFDLSLYSAIEKLYEQKNLPINDQMIKRDMSNYLFNPDTDKDVLVKDLSGGQKARLQLIRLLIGNPNLLILDEPTNHLDLPSIEELEQALVAYTGAIIYISHDSYFTRIIGGKQITIGS
jgi:ATP-binding cassette subfamily F protein 3